MTSSIGVSMSVRAPAHIRASVLIHVLILSTLQTSAHTLTLQTSAYTLTLQTRAYTLTLQTSACTLTLQTSADTQTLISTDLKRETLTPTSIDLRTDTLTLIYQQHDHLQEVVVGRQRFALGIALAHWIYELLAQGTQCAVGALKAEQDGLGFSVLGSVFTVQGSG